MPQNYYEYVNTCKHMDLFNKYLFECLEPLFNNWKSSDYSLCRACYLKHVDNCTNYHNEINFDPE